MVAVKSPNFERVPDGACVRQLTPLGACRIPVSSQTRPSPSSRVSFLFERSFFGILASNTGLGADDRLEAFPSSPCVLSVHWPLVPRHRHSLVMTPTSVFWIWGPAGAECQGSSQSDGCISSEASTDRRSTQPPGVVTAHGPSQAAAARGGCHGSEAVPGLRVDFPNAVSSSCRSARLTSNT